jgi:hypothetical protein
MPDIINYLKFLHTQRIKGFTIPDRPHFDDETTTKFFLKMLRDCNSYLEWGAGGSTVVAASLNKKFTSIDSDKFFLESVKTKITATNPSFNTESSLVHMDIGLTYYWGYPLQLSKSLSHTRRAKYEEYSASPLKKHKKLSPDLILIDGRFRVACALNSALYAIQNQSSCTILVDDYTDRAHYKVIEDAIGKPTLIKRMAIFDKFSAAREENLAVLLQRYSTDPR